MGRVARIFGQRALGRGLIIINFFKIMIKKREANSMVASDRHTGPTGVGKDDCIIIRRLVTGTHVKSLGGLQEAGHPLPSLGGGV